MINLIETPQRAGIKVEYNVDGDVRLKVDLVILIIS